MPPKKDKKSEKEKLEAKKAKKAEKQNKTTAKRVKKELKDAGEEDIEKILADCNKRESQRSVVSIYPCAQPSPRSNFSMTALQADYLLFGGEFSDGQSTVVFNDLFRWNLEKNEWRQIESLNTPPPRCSHQSVYYKDKVYMFGGEYATLDQFHHYRDFWTLDLKTNTWTEIKATGELPSARSGHRMIVWRNYLILFGGFYEAMRELHWYNDLYLYSIQEERWTQIKYKPNTQVPRARSGVQMALHSAEDVLYIYGGYSKEKESTLSQSNGGQSQKKEGRIHEDMWSMNLRALLTTAGSAGSGGKQSLDTTKAIWRRVTRKGTYPSARCGGTMTVYKNKAVLFGGVLDDEGLQHSMMSTFYSDMYAFDMERKRWYQLGVKRPKSVVTGNGTVETRDTQKKINKLKKKEKAVTKVTDGEDGDEDNEGSQDDEDESEDEDEAVEASANDSNNNEDPFADGNFFGYIDDSGNVVYLDLETDVVVPAEPLAVSEVSSITAAETVLLQSKDINKEDSSLMSNKIDILDGLTTKVEDMNLCVDKSVTSVIVVGNNGSNHVNNNNDDNATELINVSNALSTNIIDINNKDATIAATTAVVANGSNVTTTTTTTNNPSLLTPLSKYFIERVEPSPRINPCLLVRGNTLYLYGGITEVGDVEVTLDDCWSIDLSKRDMWRKVLQGNMHMLVWKGEDPEGTEASEDDRRDSDDDSDDDDDDDDDDESDGEGETEGIDNNTSSHNKGTKKSKSINNKSNKSSSLTIEESDLYTADLNNNKINSSSSSSSTITSKTSSRRGGASTGLRAEMESLRSQLDATDTNRTPRSGESLKMFYGRTTDYWTQEAIRQWREKNDQPSGVTSNEPMSEKEFKREGFLCAEIRYNELLPVLSRLNELEAQQQAEEKAQLPPERGGGSKSSSSSSFKRR